MDAKKKERLEKAGWTVGTAKEFLGLSDEEAKAIDEKLDAENASKKEK